MFNKRYELVCIKKKWIDEYNKRNELMCLIHAALKLNIICITMLNKIKISYRVFIESFTLY